MKVLVACEESQAVCKAFRDLGHEAFSCDIQDCSGGHPEWHIKGDVLPLIDGGCSFTTVDGCKHSIDGPWDLLIAHPPCTYLCVSGAPYLNVAKWGDKARKRMDKQIEAAEFFMQFANARCDRIAIENPVGYMNTHYRKPDQIIQPYEYGHPYTKRTCLWLKGLPKLVPTDVLEKPETGWDNQNFSPDGRYNGFGGKWGMSKDGKWLRFGDPEVSKLRSKTFPGIARAMAEQWGGRA